MRRAALLLSAVVLLGACGDDGPSRASFTEEANAVCQERRDALTDLRRSPGGKEAYFDVLERELAASDGLEPPDGLRAGWRRYLELVRGSLAAEKRSIELTTHPDPDVRGGDEMQAAIAEATRTAVQMRRQAERIGLEVCAEMPA